MRDQRLEIKDIVKRIDDAVQGDLDVPEFQRRFVWSAEKAKEFVDSLWRGYPVGALLLWESTYDSPKSALGAQPQKKWIVDGQQRVTSLALLFGKKPYWWPGDADWNRYFDKYDVLVNLSGGTDALEFSLPNPVRRKSSEWVSVRKILSSTNLSGLASELCAKLPAATFDSMHESLQSVRKIESFPIFEIIIDHDLEDVAEIFNRLNSAGTKIRESDVIIALVASRQKGWVRTEFDAYLRDLSAKGYDLDPGVLIRTLAAIGKGAARLRDIDKSFWEPTAQFNEAWKKTKAAVAYTQKRMAEWGILSSELMPAHNVLIPMFALRARFENDFDFKQALHWFLWATRDGRYSGAAATTLDQDIKAIAQASSFADALRELKSRLDKRRPFTKEDYLEDYRDGFVRLMLYLTAFNQHAKDWIHQDVRVGYDRSDNQLNEGFRPEWHHFFPKKVLRDQFEDRDINAAANIVVLNEKANRTFSAKEPSSYLKLHSVSLDRLTEQFVPAAPNLQHLAAYREFLSARADLLAEGSNAFMDQLEKG